MEKNDHSEVFPCWSYNFHPYFLSFDWTLILLLDFCYSFDWMSDALELRTTHQVLLLVLVLFP